MSKKTPGGPSKRRAAAVRAAASKALASILEPLAGFVLDSGLSVRELEDLFRAAAVHSVAARQRASQQRVNISGIAATTGIPRAEISQILRTPKRHPRVKAAAQTPINRILTAWHEEPGYQTSKGKPAELRVFGAAPSFDALVKQHGAGLPTRAVLDELTRVGASSVVGIERIRINSFAAISTEIGPKEIRVFAEKASRLLSALSIIEHSQGHDFLAGISAANIESSQLPIFRREVAARTADFVSAMRENLSNDEVAQKSIARSERQVIHLAVIYKEGSSNSTEKKSNQLRRNLRRMPGLNW